MSVTDTELKAKKTQTSTNTAAIWCVPLQAVLEAFLPAEAIAGTTPEEWWISSGGGERGLEFHFSRTETVHYDAEGNVAPEPDADEHDIVSRRTVEKMIAHDIDPIRKELEAIAQVARDGGQTYGGQT